MSGRGSLLRSTTPGHDLSLVKRYAGLVIDLDGVVVRGTEPVREAVAFLKGARRNEVSFVLVTNNATRTPQAWVVRDLGQLDGPEPPVVRPASRDELPAIEQLLDAEHFDAAGAAARIDRTLVAVDPDRRIVGAVAWEPVGQAASGGRALMRRLPRVNGGLRADAAGGHLEGNEGNSV
ncbi:MAG TPA: hypothetical protein VGA36_05075 [Nitriliruptorales bacterium]